MSRVGGDDTMSTPSDGTTVAIVAMLAGDAERLVRFHRTLSPETTHRRFFSVHPELSAQEVQHFTHVDHIDREALVAIHDGEIVGVARFERLSSGGDVAEVAFVVADSWQGRGLGTLLFARLWAVARARGIHRLTADVLRDNTAMLTVFRHAGLEVAEHGEREVVHVSLTVSEPESGAAEASSSEAVRARPPGFDVVEVGECDLGDGV